MTARHLTRPRAYALLSVVSVGSWLVPGGDALAAHFVIPPGREDVLGQMTGVGAGQIAGCELLGAQVDKDHVVARYRCQESGAVSLWLVHPSAVEGRPRARTEHFALVDAPGEPPAPAALADLVAARVRAAEGGWEWVVASPASTSAEDAWVSSTTPRWVVAAIATGMLAAAGGWIALRRRRRASR